MRPLLIPAARRLWRDRETLQLGRPPSPAVVLAGVDPAARSVLGLLDGTQDRAGVLRAADALGSPPHRTEQVLDLLSSSGLLDDAAADRSALSGRDRGERERIAPELASLRLVRGADPLPVLTRRRRTSVAVVGAGRVGAAVAGLLAGAGIGRVQVVDDGVVRPEDCGVGGLGAADVGRRRDAAVADLIAAIAPGSAPGPACAPDVVVLAPAAGDPVADPPAVPHLVAEVRGSAGVVGPLVQPGVSACLRCLDLERCDRDPDWPSLAVQLATPAREVTACDGALALAVAAQAALQVTALVDSADHGADDTSPPATLGGTLELVLPDWRWRRRSWQLHPDCACHRIAC